jgi:hypothetical protein
MAKINYLQYDEDEWQPSKVKIERTVVREPKPDSKRDRTHRTKSKNRRS